MVIRKTLKILPLILVVLAMLIVGSSVALGSSQVDTLPQTNADGAVQAAPFVVNPERFDPYKQFKFRVKWDNEYIYGITKVSGLVRATEVVTTRNGAEPSTIRRSPGLTLYEPIVLERGVTHDPAFEEWANLVWAFGAGLGSEVTLSEFRKDIYIELLNEAGQVVKAWMVYRSWPSEYVAVSEFDAHNPDTAIESLTLQHEGWERDTEVTEPTEP
jgi:phage tail-like protein